MGLLTKKYIYKKKKREEYNVIIYNIINTINTK